MTKLNIGGSMLVFLGLTAIVSGQDVAPRTKPAPAADMGATGARSGRTDRASQNPKEIARAQPAIAEVYRYKGTTVVTMRNLRADDKDVKQVRELLSKADFVPEERLQRFARLDFDIVVVGWQLTIQKLEVRKADTLVRVLASPLLRAPGEGKIGVFSYCREDYCITGGKLQFLGCEPLPDDLSINLVVQ